MIGNLIVLIYQNILNDNIFNKQNKDRKYKRAKKLKSIPPRKFGIKRVKLKGKTLYLKNNALIYIITMNKNEEL